MFSLAFNRFFASTASNAASGLRIYKGMLIPKAPTKPPSAFSSYVKQSKGGNIKSLAASWNQLSAKEKEKYNNKEGSEQYKKDVDSYNKKYRFSETTARSGYQMFIKEQFAQNKDSKLSLAEVAKSWGKLSEAEKEKYNKRTKQQKTSKYHIPTYAGKAAYQHYSQLNKNHDKKYSELSQEEKKKYTDLEQKDKNDYEKQLDAFCKEHNITRQDLEKLQNKQSTRSRSRTSTSSSVKKTSDGKTQRKSRSTSTKKKSDTEKTTKEKRATKTTTKSASKQSDKKGKQSSSSESESDSNGNSKKESKSDKSDNKKDNSHKDEKHSKKDH